MQRRIFRLKLRDILEERIASIFRVENCAKQETKKKQVAR
jgi:hypothetical protein